MLQRLQKTVRVQKEKFHPVKNPLGGIGIIGMGGFIPSFIVSNPYLLLKKSSLF